MDKLKELEIIDTVVGQGDEVRPGDIVIIHYIGKLYKGAIFDSSYERGNPFQTPIPGKLIEGWNQGILGLKVGGKRTLNIPSELGYGSKGAGNSIPPDSDLTFEVELVEAFRSLKASF
jgi:FKBP-type peptidyl-prolyl cis-trans isomerase